MVCDLKFPTVSPQSPGLTVKVHTMSGISIRLWNYIPEGEGLLLSGIQMEPIVS